MDPIASPPPLVPVMFVKTIFFISILQITAFTLKKNFCVQKSIHLLVRMKITYVKPGPAKFFSNNCRYIMNSSWYL